jgi:hypothetical protein
MNVSELCLIALTEAPTQNILRWCSRIYEQNGINNSIYRAVSTGYHDQEVWKSVLFQLHQALYILHNKEICIWNFNLENNVFIKETNFDNNNIGYWRYIINGIEFYVPNYGAIVLIDTSFKDLNVESSMLTTITDFYNGTTLNPVHLPPSTYKGIDNLDSRDFRYKIMMGNIFDDDQKPLINTRSNSNFKSIFSRGSFDSTTDKIEGFVKPDNEILDLIENIGGTGSGKKNDMDNIILNHGHFLHTRMGTILGKTEIPEFPSGNTDFKRGELVGYSNGDNYLVGMIYDTFNLKTLLGTDTVKLIKLDRPNKKVITSIIDIEIGSIIKLTEKLKQVYKPNSKLADEELIETYEINF